MTLSRRKFVQTAGIGAGAALTSSIWGRGREHSIWSAIEPDLQAVDRGVICIASNENPVGPGKAVLDSLRTLLEGGAKPGRYSNQAGQLTENICAHFKVKPDNVLLSEGSTEILRAATQVFTSKTKALVGTIPTYEECAGYAELIGHPVRGVSLNSEFKLDVDKMAAAAKGAGLVFYCNPNNPTATYVGAKATREFLAKVNSTSPDTTILIDEAYFDYVTNPDHETHIPIAVENPRVIVARTFSKAYGMAGLRQGYAIAHPETIKKMREWCAASGTGSLNVFGLAAATVAIAQDATFTTNERNRNKAVRDMAAKWFTDRGMKPTDCQANFMFVNIGTPAKAFREACRAKGVMVARDFPPFEKTHARITLGTMEEMTKALQVFGDVLGKKTNTAAA
ncbi:MAG TPA: histidinol-phosphate transaminase [Vicinamibacterales bacterium]|nr:histidinol-phosphate transaminase [Vicinamibacterales bacterium]